MLIYQLDEYPVVQLAGFDPDVVEQYLQFFVYLNHVYLNMTLKYTWLKLLFYRFSLPFLTLTIFFKTPAKIQRQR